MNFKFFDLQMFSEGAAAPAASTGESGVVGAEATDTGDTAVPKARKGKEDPFKNVKFGKQVNDETDTEAETSDTETDNTANKESDNKEVSPKTYTEDEYKERLSKEMKRRLKAQEKDLAPIMRYLSEEFGIEDTTDLKTLAAKADEARKARYEQQSLETGADRETIEKNADNAYEVQNYRQQMKAEREQAEADAFNQKMDGQVREARAIYPEFDFAKEIHNPVFKAVINAGGTVLNAYESAHPAETRQAIIDKAYKKAQEKLAGSINANAQRPSEGAIANSSTAKVITDPKSLTKAERAEIKNRVRRGEKIIW